MADTTVKMKCLKPGVFYRHYNSTSLIVQLKKNTKLYFVGKCSIKILKGSVGVLGFELNSNTPLTNIYSPKGHSSLLYLKTKSTKFKNRTHALKYLNGDDEGIFQLDVLKEMEGAVFLMGGFENSWCDGLRTYAPNGISLMGRKPQAEWLGTCRRIPLARTLMQRIGFRFASDYQIQTKRVFEVPNEWRRVYRDPLENPHFELGLKIATFGGKGVGKSTFNRWIVNKFTGSLSSDITLFIDLDIGQPEFTPPGVISLFYIDREILGPNFTHIRQPVKSIYIGTISVAESVKTYINGMKELKKYIDGDTKSVNCDFVINTMGYCQGLGVDLAVEAIKIFRPNIVVQIGINNERRCYPFDLTQEDVSGYDPVVLNTDHTDWEIELPHYNFPLKHSFFRIQSICDSEEGERNQNQWGFSSKDLRDTLIVSYFAAEINHGVLKAEPKMISLDEVVIGATGLGRTLNYEHVLQAINGNLVALCKTPCRNSTFDNRLYHLEIGKVVDFVGYGIVRSIDLPEKKLHIITPLSKELLETCTNYVVNASNIGLPSMIFGDKPLLDNHEDPYIVNAINGVPGNKLHAPSKRGFAPKKIEHRSLGVQIL